MLYVRSKTLLGMGRAREGISGQTVWLAVGTYAVHRNIKFILLERTVIVSCFSDYYRTNFPHFVLHFLIWGYIFVLYRNGVTFSCEKLTLKMLASRTYSQGVVI